MLLVGVDISLEEHVLNVHATWPRANLHCEWEQCFFFYVHSEWWYYITLYLSSAKTLSGTVPEECTLSRYITAWISLFFVWKVVDIGKATIGVPSLSLSTQESQAMLVYSNSKLK